MVSGNGRSLNTDPGRREGVLVRAGCQLLLCACVSVALAAVSWLGAAPARAAFTRPFLRQITETPAGPLAPGSIALDGKNDLWVSQPGAREVAGFEYPFDGFREAVTLESAAPPKAEGATPPELVAINHSSGYFYTTAKASSLANYPSVEVFDEHGIFVKRFGPLDEPLGIAVDNSSKPSEGSVYVAAAKGAGASILKFTASGAEADFEASAPYIKGNVIESAKTPFGGTLEAVTVDGEGNIYAVYGRREGVTETSKVYEFAASGEYIQSFGADSVPGIGGGPKAGDGFGGSVHAIAIDPVSGHIIVAVSGDDVANDDEGAVDEFDSSGHFLNQISGTEVESSHGVDVASHVRSAEGLSVDSGGDLYVLDNETLDHKFHEHAVDVYGPGAYLPSLKLNEASERTESSAVLSGQVDPEARPLSDCHFEYVPQAQFEATGFAALSSEEQTPCVPGAASIPSDSAYHHVEAHLTGLVSGTTYRYRLVAISSGALGGSAASAPLAFTAPHAPRIGSSGANNISSTFVNLYASIDPSGAQTSYRFEYVAQAGYEALAADPYHAGASAPAEGEVAIGAGGSSGASYANVVQQVGGLEPGTTYHYRVVAQNSVDGKVEVTAGPDGTFATLARVLPGLPDNRAWELVTPAHKGGAGDMFGDPLVNGEFENARSDGYASQSGNGFLLETTTAFGPFPATGANVYVFKRDPAKQEWAYTALASPSLGAQSTTSPLVFTPELSKIGFLDTSGSGVSETGTSFVSLIGAPGGPYTTLHVDLPAHDNETLGSHIAGASHDLGHVVLESQDRGLCAGAESQDPGSRLLCEWSGGYEQVGGATVPALALVNVDSEGALLNRCGAELGHGAEEGGAYGAVSTDGSRIVFTAPDPQARNDGPGCWNGATANAPQVYVRQGGETVDASAPEEGVSDPTGRHPAVYVGASENGARVFFVTEAELTGEAVLLGLHDPELYEYNSEDGKLARVSAGQPGSPSASAGAEVLTVPAISADGSTAYFTARGRLTTDAPQPSGEEINLYRYDNKPANGGGAAVTYVGTVNDYDYPTVEPKWGQSVRLGDSSGEVGLEQHADWYTTPDGRYLLFASGSELTGYRTSGPCGLPATQSEHNGHCDELYRYDALAGEHHEPSIVCVSCNPSGAPPVSNALFGRSYLQGSTAPPVRAISDDGSYVFFDTADALVPQDTNGTLDVYEWHDGAISLISSGKDLAPSYFLGMSPDGSNVFFGTHARLVAQDTDSDGDVYDARVCTTADPCFGGAAGGTAQCEGDACHNPPPAPIDATPASLTFSGVGNVQEKAASVPATGSKTKSAAQVRAEKLARALKACRARGKPKRGRCEALARRRYRSEQKQARALKARTSRRGKR